MFKLPSSKSILLFGVVLLLAIAGVLPSRSERRAWSAEKQLFYGLGSLALVVGLGVAVARLEARKKKG